MMRTYRLVAHDFWEQEPSLKTTVCIDIIIRGTDEEDFRRVGNEVHNFLDSGPFCGSWVDDGTDRTEAITLA